MQKRKKFLGYCEKCKKSLCEEHTYFYVDGNNSSITNNSPYLCKKCYENMYNEKIKTEVDLLKDKIIDSLQKVRIEHCTDVIRIDNLILYIENL